MRPTPRLHIRPAQGFMLIEVLVSVLLFSVGVLALVGMQANMTRAQSAAKTRTDAAYLARELVGVMWGDVANLGSYKTASCQSYARCNAWRAKVLQALPSASVQVTFDADPSNVGDVTIQIQWTPPDGETHNYTTVTTINANS